ncbi:MAG TPA: hypothetical protein VGQ77_12140, partial [Methylomirabilota bacterium]|nr:hypothetical protein [Methylomirabilota bacterium]
GLHHVCFETEDVGAELTAAKDKGAELIDATPRPGLAGQIGFLHPRACAGVLVELATIELAGSRAHATPAPFATPAPSATPARSATPAPSANVARSQHQSGLRFKRLIIGAEEPRATASIFQRLFGFPEVAMNGGPRVMLGVGRGTLLLVPDGDVGGREGMVALSMVAENFDDLLAAFQREGTRGVLLGTGEVTLEPVATHGVHLHISKYE